MGSAVTINIAARWHRFASAISRVEISPATLRSALQRLCARYLSNSSQAPVEAAWPPGLAGANIMQANSGDDDVLPELDAAELARYSRHLMLPEFGQQGQQKLKAARVLIVGAGGLGSPLCLYLAAAGVGTLGIVDHDRVDASNLQRQVLFGESDIGKNKAVRAAARLRDLNPYTRTRVYEQALTAANALEIIADYDLVIDATDNFPTRYLINDACVILGKPDIYGSIFRFEGQASVFNYEGGPCYRCLYPEPPAHGRVPSCAEGGVLGVLPAIIASIQATEAIKIIAGMGTSLSGRLVLYDALGMRFEELQANRKPACVVCGDQPSVTELIDYQQFCGVPAAPAPATEGEISVRDLAARLAAGEPVCILDVREAHECQICRLDGSIHIPMQDVATRLDELDREQEIVVHCKGGARAAKVCELLQQQGFKRPLNLKGGILAWANEIDSDMKTY